MLKVISQPFYIRKVFLQPLISHFVQTAQTHIPQETSFHDDFELNMNSQFLKADSFPKKPLNITQKDLDTLLLLSNSGKVSDMSLGLNKTRTLLNHLAYKNDDINLSDSQLTKAIENLKDISLNVMNNTNSYDHSLFKLFFTLAQGNFFASSNIIEMLSLLLRKESILASLNFENVANILLLLTDLKKLSDMQLPSVQVKDNLKLIIKKLQTQTEKILDQSSPSEYSYRFFLPKILFCFLQLDPRNKQFLNKLLSHLLYCDLSTLEETEVTSLLYIVIKMEKKLHILTEETKDSFYIQLQDLYSQLQQIIRERISKQLLHFKRVPHILYCLAMIGRCSQTVLDDLMKLFVTNMESYALSEVCTVMYCLWRMPELDPQNKYIVDIISFYFDKNRANLDLLSNTNLYTAFLGVRKPLKSHLEDKQKKKLDGFLQDLLKVFTKNFERLDDSSKIRILYEVTHMHKVIQRKMFFQEFIHFFLEMNLASLNNHDLITVGYIMKKFIVVNKEHFDFWNKYLECLSSREWSARIEENRIMMIFSNLKDLVMKGIQVDANQAKYRQEWLQNINQHYTSFIKNQQSLKMKGRSSNKMHQEDQ